MKKFPTIIIAFSLIAIAAMALGLAPSAQAQQLQLPGKLSDDQLMGYIGKDPLPPGTIPWQLLRQVKLVESKNKDAKPTKAPFSMRYAFLQSRHHRLRPQTSHASRRDRAPTGETTR